MELRPIAEDSSTDPVVRLPAGEAHAPEEVQALPKVPPVPVLRQAVGGSKTREKRPSSVDDLMQPATTTAYSEEDAWAQGSAAHTVPWGWIVLGVVLFASAVGWSMRQVSLATAGREQTQLAAEELLQADANEVIEAEQVVANIERAVAAFCAAESIEELLPWVRQPERVRPLMEDYYQRNRLIAPGFKQMTRVLRPHSFALRAEFWEASIATADGSEQRLILQTGDDLEAKVDWETAVCYQPLAWDDYARDRPEGSSLDFRVYLEQDFFYSHEFSDSETWLCLRLTARDAAAVLFGYVRYDRDTAVEIAELLRDQQGRAAAVLRLGIPRDLNSRRGVVIEKLVIPRWIYLDAPRSEP